MNTRSNKYQALSSITWAMVFSLVLVGCANQPPQKTTSSGPLPASTEATLSATQVKLWQVFQRYQGSPYRYGGTSSAGFDCSGFILTAYQEGLGKQIPRTTAQMLASGEVVHPTQIEPGDIVFFRIKGKDQHAGIYMGNNRFIHASSSAGVTQSNLNGYYWEGRLSKARRFAGN